MRPVARGSPAGMFQVKSAVDINSNKPSAVLWTVPMIVMDVPAVMSNPENVLVFKAGFPERSVKWRFMYNFPCCRL